MRTCVRAGEATILHADLDAFYASVEQRDDPRLRGRPVIVGGGRGAGGELRGQGARRAHRDGRRRRRGGSVPTRSWSPPRMAAYAEASRAVFEVFEDTTPLVEGLSIDEAFLDVGGLGGSRARRVEIAARAAARRCSSEVGLPDHRRAWRGTKFLAKVASGVAKPDGLLVVPPDGELDVPAPAAGRAALGRRPRSPRRSSTRAGITTVGEVARAAPRRRWWRCSGGRRAGSSTRSPTTATRDRCRSRRRRRSMGAQRALGRCADGARRARRGRRRRSSTGSPAPARGAAGRPHGRAAAALRRLLARHPLAHARRGHRAHAHDPRHACAGCSPRPCRSSSAGGSRWSASRSATSSTTAPSSSRCRSTAAAQRARPRARRRPRPLRRRTPITRAVLLGRDPGISVPLLPD